VPLYQGQATDNMLTQFEGPIAEKCGLLKMDFLGLRTLSTLTLDRNLELHAPDSSWQPNTQHQGMDSHGRIDIEKIDLADQTVLSNFSSAAKPRHFPV
jgi:DNA polymerase-3 subunit alpha